MLVIEKVTGNLCVEEYTSDRNGSKFLTVEIDDRCEAQLGVILQGADVIKLRNFLNEFIERTMENK